MQFARTYVGTTDTWYLTKTSMGDLASECNGKCIYSCPTMGSLSSEPMDNVKATGQASETAGD